MPLKSGFYSSVKKSKVFVDNWMLAPIFFVTSWKSYSFRFLKGKYVIKNAKKLLLTREITFIPRNHRVILFLLHKFSSCILLSVVVLCKLTEWFGKDQAFHCRSATELSQLECFRRSWYTLFFYKNLFYKNIDAEINQNFKNVLRTFLRLRVD